MYPSRTHLVTFLDAQILVSLLIEEGARGVGVSGAVQLKVELQLGKVHVQANAIYEAIGHHQPTTALSRVLGQVL